MKVGDKVYVVNWGMHYGNIRKYNNKTQKQELIFPLKTEIPEDCDIMFHRTSQYVPNLTLKGTVNKRDPRKRVGIVDTYKNYKWEVLEMFPHPKAGELIYPERTDMNEYKHTTDTICLLASTHEEVPELKCYIIIEQSGVSLLTPEQYTSAKFDAMIEANLGKWDRDTMNRKDVPKEIISVFYDDDDHVLFGSSMVRGLVSYSYLQGKFSTDGNPIYLHSSINYDGKGLSGLKEEDKHLIKPFHEIKAIVESKQVH